MDIGLYDCSIHMTPRAESSSRVPMEGCKQDNVVRELKWLFLPGISGAQLKDGPVLKEESYRYE